MLRIFLYFNLMFLMFPVWAKVEGTNPSPTIPISNRPWLERAERQDMIEGIYSQAPEGFNEEGFNTFFDLDNNESIVYGFTFLTRREFPDEPRYYLYKPNLSFTNTNLGDVSLIYLQYQRATERKAYVLAMQFAEQLIGKEDKELRFIFRPVFADNEGITEAEETNRVKQFLALIGLDLKGQDFRASAFGTFSSFPTQDEPLNIQTELFDLTDIEGLQNVSGLARYMYGAHLGYKLTPKIWINTTYAQIWTSRHSYTGTVFPTLAYHFNKYFALRGAFQRVVGSDIFGSRNYGVISIALGRED